jgi:hypothetical protein
MNYAIDENASETVEGVKVRAERQRERAARWTRKYEDLRSIYNNRQQLAEQIKTEYEALIVQTTAEYEDAMDGMMRKSESQRTRIGELLAIIGDLQSHVSRLRNKIDRDKKAVRVGEQELEKRLRERIARRVEKLVAAPWYGDDGEPVGWLRRAIKRGCPPHVCVYIEDGSVRPQLLGESGYHTTPSGKTVVTYPNAYKWRTVYHRSTERITVGRKWIEKNIRALAESDSAMKIKR